MSEQTRQQIAKINSKLQDVLAKSTDLDVIIGSLRAQQDNLIAQLIEEEELLGNTNWELKLNGKQSPFLRYLSNPNDFVMETIKKLSDTGCHSWFELSDGIIISFDDDEVQLSFNEPKQIPAFLKKYKLNLSGTGIVDRLARLKREADALEEIAHQFKL